MGKLENDLNFHSQSAQTDMGERQEIASHLSRNAAVESEDPTRSTLHTGEQHSGVLPASAHTDGAPEQHTDQNERDYSADGPVAKPESIEQASVSQQTTGTTAQNSSAEVPIDAQNMMPGEVFRTTSFTPKANVDVSLKPENAPSMQRGLYEEQSIEAGPVEAPSERNEGQDTASQNVISDAEDSTVDQPGTPEMEALKPVEVPEANRPPEAVVLDQDVVSENEAGVVVGTISVVDPDAADTHSFQVSDDRFEIVDGQLKLKPDITLDYEQSASIDVDVTVTDAAGDSLTEQITVTVQNVNEAPEAATLDHNAVAENAEAGVVGTLSVMDPDTADTHSFELSDDRFEVVDGQLKLKPGAALDFETEQAIAVEVTATDAEGLSLTEHFKIDVQDVNEAPTDLALESNTENLIQNGSFEDFDLEKGKWKGFESDNTGAWQNTDGMEIWDHLRGTKASDGEQLLEMDHARGTDSISQVIQTEDGQLYDLGIDLRERLANGTDTVEVYWKRKSGSRTGPAIRRMGNV